MPTGDYNEDDVYEALCATGLNKEDLIYMPSALFALGKMTDTPLREIPDRIYKSVRSVIGGEGTLTVPASFDDYARFGTPYDTRRSRVDPGKGALSQFVADLPTSFRSYCPLNAVAGIGPDAQEVCHGWTGASYGAGSAWDMFYERDATFLFLGIEPNQAFKFITTFSNVSASLTYITNSIPFPTTKMVTASICLSRPQCDILMGDTEYGKMSRNSKRICVRRGLSVMPRSAAIRYTC